jgi:hypothetical protein
VGKVKHVFGALANSMAFVHLLESGLEVNETNMDIAMVKLGRQCEYARGRNSELQQWERKKAINWKSWT